MRRELGDHLLDERQDLDGNAVEIVVACAREFAVERFEARGRQHDVDTIESLASKRGRPFLQSGTERQGRSAPPGGLAQPR